MKTIFHEALMVVSGWSGKQNYQAKSNKHAKKKMLQYDRESTSHIKGFCRFLTPKLTVKACNKKTWPSLCSSASCALWLWCVVTTTTKPSVPRKETNRNRTSKAPSVMDTPVHPALVHDVATEGPTTTTTTIPVTMTTTTLVAESVMPASVNAMFHWPTKPLPLLLLNCSMLSPE